ncbi:hypothetical protein HPB50_025114 [Hyalomma asiaticum]|uniref:Uncharacterized protein n=1 Tax=Hyalomma asiaticum TaxID=266040 RepID=A0ACB7SQY9_HYAAI|nr:hypothetical protein HPB50_025114 [Hyalomma asiaticum]
MGGRPTAVATGPTAMQISRWPSLTLRFALLLLLGAQYAHCLDNGLARTPPMGWLSWERFMCNVDCANDPENCISERLYKEMGDAMVEQGYRRVGYEYVNIDDCWMTKERDELGRLQANRTRFPNGIKHLAKFMHARGLKLGIYGDVGTKTCAGYAGSEDYLLNDALTFSDWNVDMVKMDGCFANISEYKKLYSDFGKALNQTGRPMVYSCSWPAYEVFTNITPNYHLIGHHCNMWRNYGDIADTWRSVESIIDYYAKNQDVLVDAAAPGRWNDPDMLVIGNFGLSYDQSKAQMALWAIMAAPLLMSHDLRRTRPEFVKILQNRAVIAVNQDPLGIMGKRVRTDKNIETWIRPVTPVVDGSTYSYALVFFNRNVMGNTRKHVTQLGSLGLRNPFGYLGLYYPDSFLKVRVNPSGGIVMLKAEAVRAPPLVLTRTGQELPKEQQATHGVTPVGGLGAGSPNGQPQNVPPQNTVTGIDTPSGGVVLVYVKPVTSAPSALPTSSLTVSTPREGLDGAVSMRDTDITRTLVQP